MIWTKPFCGVIHINRSPMFPLVTVCDYNSFAILQVTAKQDMGFYEQQFDTVEEAKDTGEKRLKLLLGEV